VIPKLATSTYRKGSVLYGNGPVLYRFIV